MPGLRSEPATSEVEGEHSNHYTTEPPLMTVGGLDWLLRRLLHLGCYRRGGVLMLVTWCKQLWCIHLTVGHDSIFAKRLERPDMCELSSPVAEATDSWLKVLVGLMVKSICLEVPADC